MPDGFIAKVVNGSLETCGGAFTRRSYARQLHCNDELLLEVRARITQAAIPNREWTGEAAVYLASGGPDCVRHDRTRPRDAAIPARCGAGRSFYSRSVCLDRVIGTMTTSARCANGGV